MAEDLLIVTRWVRYGHDRLYIRRADGSSLGYRDNKAGTDQLEKGVDPEEFRAALAAYWAGGGKPAPTDAPERPADLAAEGTSTADRPTAVGRHAAPEPPPPVAPAPAAAPAATAAPTPVPEATAPAPASAVTALPAMTAPPAVTAPPAATAPPEPPWTDLSLSRPGAAAREQALAKRAEAPVKTMLARMRRKHTDERAWRIGADGEELVAAQLQRLGPAWKVLHAVPVGERGSDIDHVLIGPGGVYTINAKHHPGASVWVGGNTVIVNGNRTSYVRNSRHEAGRAAGILSGRVGFPVVVTGLVAVICPRGKVTEKSQPPGGDVYVLAWRKLVEWLSHRGTVLTPEQVEALFEVARRSTTWAR